MGTARYVPGNGQPSPHSVQGCHDPTCGKHPFSALNRGALSLRARWGGLGPARQCPAEEEAMPRDLECVLSPSTPRGKEGSFSGDWLSFCLLHTYDKAHRWLTVSEKRLRRANEDALFSWSDVNRGTPEGCCSPRISLSPAWCCSFAGCFRLGLLYSAVLRCLSTTVSDCLR